MSIKMTAKIILGVTFLSLSLKGHSQTILIEEDFSSGIPVEWSVFDEDGLTTAEAVSMFTEAWISWIDENDTAAASTSYYDPSGTAEDYLITPRISLVNFSRLVWTARSGDASYPDGYQVLISTTDSLPDSFTDTLWFTNAAAPYYQTNSIVLDEMGYTNQDVFIALRNTTNDGYTLLLDQLKIYGAETASTNDAEFNTTLNLYPNPANESFTISSDAIIEQVMIYNNAGQLVKSTVATRIDISTISSGIYQVLIMTDKGLIRRKLIKT